MFLCVAKSSNSSFIVLLYGYRFDVKLEMDEKALLDNPEMFMISMLNSVIYGIIVRQKSKVKLVINLISIGIT